MRPTHVLIATLMVAADKVHNRSSAAVSRVRARLDRAQRGIRAFVVGNTLDEIRIRRELRRK